MPYSPYVRNHLQDLLLGRTEYVPPSTLYFALFIGDEEVSAPSYARVAVANDGTSFPAGAVDGEKAVAIGIEWPVAAEDWGLVDSVRVYDAASGGFEQNRQDVGPFNVITGRKPMYNPSTVTFALQA